MTAASSSAGPDAALAHDFVRFAMRAGVLRFGEFRTKAGRLSPYFFNAGLFDDGAKLGQLAQFYARRLLAEQRRTNGVLRAVLLVGAGFVLGLLAAQMLLRLVPWWR